MAVAQTSYGTQFARAQRKFFPSAEIQAKLHSKKALERRLVLPLEQGQWTRAFEVLNAKYAAAGRHAAHVDQILKCMVRNVFPHNRHTLVPALDAVRDQMFDGTLPSSSSLWATLAVCYCRVDASREAMEAIDQWKQRFGASTSSRHQLFSSPEEAKSPMPSSSSPASPSASGGSQQQQRFVNEFQAREVCRALLPLLARNGQIDAMRQVTAKLFSSPETAMRGDGDMQRWLQEGRARSGDWTAALAHFESSHSAARQLATTGSPAADTYHNDALVVLRGLCRAGRWEDGMRWFSEREESANNAASHPSRWHDQGLQERRRCVMECLVFNAPAARRWNTAAAFFLQYGVLRPASNAAPQEAVAAEASNLVVDTSMLTMLLQCLEGSMVHKRKDPHHHTSAAATAPPTAPPPVRPQQQQLSVGNESSASQFTVALLDQLSFHCENFTMDNIGGAAFLKALLIEGIWERALHLAGATPLLKGLGHRKSTSPSSADGGDASDAAQRQLYRALEHRSERKIVAMLYALHGSYGDTAKQFTLTKYPYAFPKEVFRPGGIASQLMEEVHRGTGASIAGPASVRARPKTTAGLTELADQVMKEQVLALAHTTTSLHGFGSKLYRQQRYVRPSRSYDDDPQKDPRAAPVGLHDAANGWNFNGRAGLPMPTYHRGKHGHLLTSVPKHMPSKKNPMRSWNPQLNSSLGHRDNVRKWNGSTSV